MFNNDGAIRCAVKEYRKRKGLSQDELAQLIGVRRQAVYDMESGRYLPNTAVALRLARVLGCTVEMLFAVIGAPHDEHIHLLHEAGTDTRLSLVQVRERLVGIPMSRAGTLSLELNAADGFLLPDNTIETPLSHAQLAKTILLLGCDPALAVLGELISRSVPGLRTHTVFSSSRRALLAVNAGNTHIGGIHYHSSSTVGGNIEAVRALSPNMDCLIVTFSMQEEGIMVAPRNPHSIRTVEDLAATERIRFVTARKVPHSENCWIRIWPGKVCRFPKFWATRKKSHHIPTALFVWQMEPLMQPLGCALLRSLSGLILCRWMSADVISLSHQICASIAAL